jgi:hypothetical protein
MCWSQLLRALKSPAARRIVLAILMVATEALDDRRKARRR